MGFSLCLLAARRPDLALSVLRYPQARQTLQLDGEYALCKAFAAMSSTLPAFFSEARQMLPRIRGYALACAISGSSGKVEPHAGLSVMVPVFFRSHSFPRVFNENKVPCRLLSDRQSLQKALYTARAHLIIPVRTYEHMHKQTLEMHKIEPASWRAVADSTEG